MCVTFEGSRPNTQNKLPIQLYATVKTLRPLRHSIRLLQYVQCEGPIRASYACIVSGLCLLTKSIQNSSGAVLRHS
jgi:hypothetical protein